MRGTEPPGDVPEVVDAADPAHAQFDDPNVGVRLKDDPFFQLVKNSKTVREMLINANEEFSADRVIEKALRQDVGPDPTLGAKKEKFKYMDF